MHKRYKVRLFPTPEQEEKLWEHINGCRYIWNYMLNMQEEVYQNGGKFVSHFDMIKLLTPLKNDGEHDWLYKINNGSMRIVCRDLDRAYREFFNKIQGRPHFKSKKKAKPSYPLCQEKGKFYFLDNNFVVIPSIKHVKYKTDFSLNIGKEYHYNNPRISYVGNKWILTFGIEFENQEQELNDYNMGIDLGVKELAVVAVDDQKIVYHNINKSRRMKTLEHKKKHIQRVIRRKYRTNGSYDKTNSIIKYENILRDIIYKQKCIRRNYIQQVTHELILMLPKRVIMENLNVNGLLQNKHISGAIRDQMFCDFKLKMKYKCEWAGIEFVQADRFYPSSKTCSRCGEIKKDLKLSDRVYKCPCCGLEIDRDYNAAINLMNYSCPTE